VFDHLVEIPVVAGSWSPGHTQGTQVQVLGRAKKQRANLKPLRCNSVFEARRHSFLGVPGTNVERFLRGVSPPGLPLLNWQRSPQRRRTGDEASRNNLLTREGSRVYKRAPIQVAKEVILGQTNQLLHFCYIDGITS